MLNIDLDKVVLEDLECTSSESEGGCNDYKDEESKNKLDSDKHGGVDETSNAQQGWHGNKHFSRR